jgi:SpoVK/Ycf46/Vps4 family AAA+-type ATPase
MATNKTDLLQELKLLIRSRYGLIVIDTVEEERAGLLIKLIADHMNLPLFTWNYARGLRRADLENTIYGTNDPAGALAHIQSVPLAAVYHFQGLGPYLETPELQDRLLSVAQKFEKGTNALILTGSNIGLNESLKVHAAFIKMPLPSRNDFRVLVQQVCRDVSKRMNVRNELLPSDLERLIANLQGLTLLEAKKILTRAMIENGKLCGDEIQAVILAKKEIIEKEGLLEYYPVEESMADIADLAGLKQWLEKRKSIILDPENARAYGLSFPKGILLLGVPGTGKTLCAKAVAKEWSMPLLKMDPANLYNKYIGESEKNFKRAMQTAEKMAPVVLLIDEIEKAFTAGGSEDGGTSARILGSFLSWLQDRKGDVFVVATANDIERLPPELLRKGRFDEVFFVDLPDRETRTALFSIHLKRRGQDPQKFNLEELADRTEGYSGAEIEQVVISALYSSFAAKTKLDMTCLMDETGKTIPLCRTRAEHIEALREWARTRTVGAN